VHLSVRLSVHKNFSRFAWNLVCRWRSTSDAGRYAVWPDARSRSRSQDLESWKFGHFQNVSPPHIQFELASDCRLLNWRTISKFVRAGFLKFGLVFVSRDFEVRCSSKVAKPVRRSWPSVPHRTNLYLCAFSALTLLVGWQEGHPACKNFCFKTPWDGS